MPDLSIERLKQVYLYKPETGEFIRLIPCKSHKGRAKIGEAGGSISGERYRRIGVDGRLYRAHRLAWFYMTGAWPKHGIDHVDLNPENNRWENLRAADQSQNGANTRIRRDNTSGFKGVQKTANSTWSAKIWVKGKKHSLGTFRTASEASQAYRIAAEKYFGEYARPS